MFIYRWAALNLHVGYSTTYPEKPNQFFNFFFPASFDSLRSILHEGQIDKRVQYMIEVMFAIRKDGFKDHPAVIADLDLVEEDDQFTHLLLLENVTTAQDELSK